MIGRDLKEGDGEFMVKHYFFRPDGSILPAVMERKRLKIAYMHTALLLLLCTLIFGGEILFLVIRNHNHPGHVPYGRSETEPTVLALLPLMMIGIVAISKLDNYVANRIGFVCPYCHHSLYDPGMWGTGNRINENGLCSKCKRSVI